MPRPAAWRGYRAARLALCALCASLLGAAPDFAPAPSVLTGVVFVDADGDGVRGADERAVAGVAVHNGFRLVETDADGRYTLLPDAPGARGGAVDTVFITRPAGYRCERWFRPAAEGGGDFALVATHDRFADGFTFIQYSDAHVYPQASDFIDFSTGPREWWLPEVVRDYFILRLGRRMTEPDYTPDLGDGLRNLLAPVLGRDRVDAMWDVQLVGALLEEFARPGSELGRVDGQIRAAFAEMHDLAPDFAISTGDLVLEGNEASAEAVERWLKYYRELEQGLGYPVYDTIGNNEIAGIDNDDFPPDDPGYGKGLYRRSIGPTYYSFDAGRFHFVALDTHTQRSRYNDPRSWTFEQPEPGFYEWLDADLDHHADRVPVLLNHEPFLYDPSWPIDEDDFLAVDDEGRIAGHHVPVVLTGHIHRNGLVQSGPTTHITTGALSGFRWVLPPDLYPRGYRLFYARGERLYSAWKRTGAPVVAFVDPPGDPAHHPASGGRPEDPGAPTRVVAVAADTSGPFPGVRILLDGRPLPIERWGPYFVAASVPDARRQGAGELVVEALSLDGRVESDHAQLPTTAPVESP